MVISNFELKPRVCRYHRLYEEFICVHPKCQYRGLMCSDCVNEGHSDHLCDIKTVPKFVAEFREEISREEKLFQKDKIIVNVKEIVKTKINELEQTLNQIMAKIIGMLDQEKNSLLEKLYQMESEFAAKEVDYRVSLEARYDCLEYLSQYKNDPEALQAKIACASEWGLVSLKGAITQLRNNSLNRSRSTCQVTDGIILEADKILKGDNFISSVKKLIDDFSGKALHLKKASFIDKSLLSNLTNHTKNTSVINTPQSSRALNSSRARVHSLMGIRPISSNQSLESRPPSIERIQKIPSDNNLGSNRYLKGVNRFNLSRVIIK